MKMLIENSDYQPVERHGKPTVNPKKNGSKFAVWHKLKLKAGEEKSIRIRLSKSKLQDPWTEFDTIFNIIKQLIEIDKVWIDKIALALLDSLAI